MHEGSCIFSACFSAESDRTNGGTGVLRVIFAERDTGQDCQVQREAATGYTKNCNNYLFMYIIIKDAPIQGFTDIPITDIIWLIKADTDN